jgi:hypothetical protein
MTSAGARRLVALGVSATLASCVDKAIVDPPPVRALTYEEIVAGLSSPVFREALVARAQLAKLSDGAWLGVLTPLSRDPSPQKRLLALNELSRRPLPQAAQLIRSLVDDPDDTVRAEARSRTVAPSTPGGAP